MPQFNLILASGSPRRRQLLTDAGYRFEVHPPRPEAEPPAEPGESPQDLVRRLAKAKADDVVDQLQAASQRASAGWIVLACDTVAAIDGEILGKPIDRADAERMLKQLRGQLHQVYTGLCLSEIDASEQQVEVVTTDLKMHQLSDEQIEEYLESGLWQGKAGGFGLQDRTGWIEVIEGSESNVVGLPLERLAAMLDRELGD